MSEGLTEYHRVFAKAALSNGGLGVIVEVNGVEVGSAIGYIALSPRVSVGVIYYVYVRPEYRGLGYGKILVLSLEELLEGRGARVYVASTSSDNRRSQALFKSLGYRVLDWRELESDIGYEPFEALEAIACMYEDDTVMIKPYDKRVLSRLRRGDYEELWYKICYKPWLEYRRIRGS